MKYCLKYGYVLLIGTILIICLFGANKFYACRRIFEYSNIQYLFIGILWISCIFFLFNYSINIKQRDKMNHFMMIINLIFFIFISILSYHYYFYTGWDVGIAIIPNAEHIAYNEFFKIDNNYFSRYPNNILLVFLFSLIIKVAALLNISNYYMCLIVFQCAIFALVGFLVYKISDMIFENKSFSLLAWFLYICLIGFSPWVVIPYSDSIGLLFPTTILYIYLRLDKSGFYSNKLVFLLVVVSYLGFKIKPQVGIVMIAITIICCLRIVELVRNCKKNNTDNLMKSKRKKIQEENKKRLQKNKTYIQIVIASTLGLFMGNVILVSAVYYCHIKIDENMTFGVSHFMMMGLNEETLGIYNEDDVAFSANFFTKKERDTANINVIKNRIIEYGFKNVISIIHAKILTNYNDGTFAWGYEGGFFEKYFSKGNVFLQSVTQKFYYDEGKYYSNYINFMQMNWILVLFFNIFIFFCKIEDNTFKVMMLSIIGLTLFEVLFEARARYLFTYIPFYIILATIGFRELIKKLSFLERWTINEEV